MSMAWLCLILKLLLCIQRYAAIADAEALTMRMHAYAFNVYTPTLVLNRVV